jgi:hypothetical protein
MTLRPKHEAMIWAVAALFLLPLAIYRYANFHQTHLQKGVTLAVLAFMCTRIYVLLRRPP